MVEDEDQGWEETTTAALLHLSSQWFKGSRDNICEWRGSQCFFSHRCSLEPWDSLTPLLPPCSSTLTYLQSTHRRWKCRKTRAPSSALSPSSMSASKRLKSDNRSLPLLDRHALYLQTAGDFSSIDEQSTLARSEDKPLEPTVHPPPLPKQQHRQQQGTAAERCSYMGVNMLDVSRR